ncbi:hypothetical protein CGRA01v4_12199 [Colletotrichum graminicola]|uniref:Uncharacterized protein n=1 Tax=Colletotrichum graminicola (strain M1.001 / M2 / FGSC 10212) TaxID=645133 RepID=E3R0K1_COLGM|nr:uncharacterized protein GLRG_11784 [Colletotrichum graminicola M1.001]EFQ36639.1 hypothetical protein GLRG_11784 [Colletotrichum graminicola M1.001]WDK20909.1 hypothetical protein CGRA01v4_12199 [Colletotrichum graminicola]
MTTTAKPNPQLCSPLFQVLPLEVRQRIYAFLLSLEHADFADTLRPMHTYLDPSSQHRGAQLPEMMVTCKLAYAEMAPRVHGEAALRVHRRGGREERRAGFAVYGPLRIERLQRLVLVVDMEHPNWNGWLALFAEVAARATGLRHLVVDWAPRPVAVVGLVGWQARQHRSKEGEFLRTLDSLGRLQTVLLYGTVPEAWSADIKRRRPEVRVKCYPFRWWREPGLE